MRPLIILALLASALGLAACGGHDGGKTGNNDAGLSPAAYRAQLTRLCLQSSRETAQIGGVQGANGSALAEYFDKVAAVAARRQKQFEGLRPPFDLQDEQSRLARLLVEEVGSIKLAASGFRSANDPAHTYQSFKTSLNNALRQQNKLVDRLRVPKCRSQLVPSAGSAQASS